MPYWVRNMAGPFNAVFGRFTFTRYLLASICALSADFALFMLLHRLGASPALAALGGYSGGLVLHWMISTQFVFEMRQPPTHGQRIAFILSALIGMAITMGLVGGLSGLGLPPAVAKLAAVPVSFLSVYAIRKYGIFARA
ncbi:polysaccharide biosynthesis protein GtrA [Sphingobium indicum IP26]|uniref:Polysaccharide biosynthesis protein GtrA n=1 Tax=Sphingobium indicum F2 TaxID=1450518 RepID=A0A8E0WSF4_9SPHN|nr:MULTISPECIES: GtrA family protein [Sphingobium]EPR16981.1 polysaccharide biosynthesis protein GtrA [Sphingobium indicum IP26]EQB04573.1 polysaccharide biosynthesis protein GtrA [Sphingobium sp. HDIP04]KER36566.1 polysaccharide biosynthesis protein GtrA [Sphingobium indicum F2]